MGGFTLLSLFAASELGGSAPVTVLKPSGATTLPDGESALTVTPGAGLRRGLEADERLKPAVGLASGTDAHETSPRPARY